MTLGLDDDGLPSGLVKRDRVVRATEGRVEFSGAAVEQRSRRDNSCLRAMRKDIFTGYNHVSAAEDGGSRNKEVSQMGHSLDSA